jgi:three-Cys-motif partner protein
MTKPDPVIVSDDGLLCPEVGSWTETKHDYVSYYAKLFSSGMKRKWGKRIYVDLYAGAGYSRIRDTSNIMMGSPLRTLMLPDAFDKYVFCEEDPEKLAALKSRVWGINKTAHVRYIQGDCNEKVAEILAEIPPGSKKDSVLSLCFADPYDN